MGKLFPIPAQPLIPPFHMIPQHHSQAFQRVQLSFPSVADCNGQARTFLSDLTLQVEGFLIEASTMGDLRRTGERVKKYRMKNCQSYISLYFSIRQEDSTGYCNLSNPQTKQHRSVVNTDTWSQLQKSFHMKSFGPKESFLQFCDCFSRILSPLGVYSC